MFDDRYFATINIVFFFPTLSRSLINILYRVWYNCVINYILLHGVPHIADIYFNKRFSRYLEFRGWHRVIIYRRAGPLQRRSRYGNARRQTENGIYARNRGERVARVIRRIDRLVFVPGRNPSPSRSPRLLLLLGL